MSFSFKNRVEEFKKIDQNHYDLIIVGGGITGAGIARDAASRGMKVALFEARDFAEGTSSRSSKLIHGGVRYLENLEFRLVFEALAERALLFKIAPHLVHPLRFLIPIYKNSRVGFWKMWAGMWLYDLLALMRTPKIHESLNTKQVVERIPVISDADMVGAVEYSDAYTDDDRLVIETLRDAHRKGATLINYASVESIERNEESIESVRIKDQISGEIKNVKAQHVVSTVGPWTDLFGQQVDPKWKKKLRPTKGVHLVFQKDRIPVSRAVVMTIENRIIFVIPRHEMVIVGTTDTDFPEDPVGVGVEQTDVDYLLGVLNRYFPKLKIKEEDIISSYAGVRPLVNDGASSEGKTSREHSIWSHGKHLSFVAGGKYTTYRKISEQAVNHVLSFFSSSDRSKWTTGQTREALNPLITSDLFKKDREKILSKYKAHKLSKSWIEKLWFRHGGEASKILDRISESYQNYDEEQAYWMGEAHFALEETCCRSLKDFYWRRSPLYLSHKNHGAHLIDCISLVFAKNFGWSEDEQNRQKQALREEISQSLWTQ